MKNNFFSLKNKNILVTGGYGHLGRKICEDLMLCGANVYCLGRSKNKFVKSFSKKIIKRINFVKIDVNKEQQVAKVVKSLSKKFKINILINNTIDSSIRGIDINMKTKDWKKNLNNTLLGYFLMTKYVSQEMIKKKINGKIINVSSLFSILAPVPEMYLDLKNEPPISMAIAKGGINQMTKYAASTLARYNINVNGVIPGWFPKRKKGDVERKDYVKQITDRIPMKKIGNPEDLSGIFIFLSSNKSDYITGQSIVVDGGYSIW